MLLPQSSAFAALKNRLNSVSAIGYLHIAPRTYVPSHARQKSTETKFGVSTPQTPSSTNFDRPNRLKPREEGTIRWAELLEKFKSVQEKARRAGKSQGQSGSENTDALANEVEIGGKPAIEALAPNSRPSSAMSGLQKPPPMPAPAPVPMHKPKSSLSNLGRFAGGVAGRNKGKK